MGQSTSQEDLNVKSLNQSPQQVLAQSSLVTYIDSKLFKKFPILETISKNIRSDYKQYYNQNNLQNIINFYAKVYQIPNRSQRNLIYNQLKAQLVAQRQINIINWLENQRSNKYDTEHLITGKSTKPKPKFNKVQICRTQVNLIPSKIMSHGNINSVKENASLDMIQIGTTTFELKDLKINNKNKQFLFRQNKNKNSNPTPWIVQKTKDHRYVWRGDIDLDRHNVDYVLKFLLKNRDQLDQCPSIVINAGSHGGSSGQNSNESGMMQYSDLDIYDEIVDVIFHLIENSQQLGLKVSKLNIKRKIYVHLVSLNIPCIYPENADHIIDVQCKGAYSKVQSQSLHPKNSTIIEENLNFLCDFQEPYNEKIIKKDQNPIIKLNYRLEDAKIAKKMDKMNQKEIVKREKALQNFVQEPYDENLQRIDQFNYQVESAKRRKKMDEMNQKETNETKKTSQNFMRAVSKNDQVIGMYQNITTDSLPKKTTTRVQT